MSAGAGGDGDLPLSVCVESQPGGRDDWPQLGLDGPAVERKVLLLGSQRSSSEHDITTTCAGDHLLSLSHVSWLLSYRNSDTGNYH